MENVVLINKKLREIYGVSLDNKPKYRLVWSEDLIEKRIGKVEKYTPNGIYLGTEDGVHELKKYSYLKDRYILETYDPAFKANVELANSDGYEPLFVFQKNGEYLKPYYWACEFIINTILGRGYVKRTESMDSREELSKEEKERMEYFDFLSQEGSSDLGQKFRYGEAIILPGGEN